MHHLHAITYFAKSEMYLCVYGYVNILSTCCLPMVLPSKVAIRTLALEREELIAQGRKVVCPDNRLICDAIPLMFARTLVEDFG